MITLVTCEKCGYTWLPRTPVPKECPVCKRRDWKKQVKGGNKQEK